MEITKQWLQENNACNSGLNWFLSQKETDCGKVMLKRTECDGPSDALWVFEKIANKKQAVSLAVFLARLCLNKYEKEFPGDDRPREAVEAAEAYLKRPCEKTRSAARAAAETAGAAGTAADTARAAWVAAWTAEAAAWAAADTADGATGAARAAARAARAAWTATRAVAGETRAADAASMAAWAVAGATDTAAFKQTQITIIKKAIEICKL